MPRYLPCTPRLRWTGKKLYELAGAGKEVERRPRAVQILDIKVKQDRTAQGLDGGPPVPKAPTYVPSCHDIGRLFGMQGAVWSISHTYQGGPFQH